VIGAELIAFSKMCNCAYNLAQEIRQVLSEVAVPLHLFTDSKSLFDVISKGSRTSEKRRMLEIACTREGFARGDISNIGFVRTGDNFADGLTKQMKTHALYRVLEIGMLKLEPEQWIVRDTPTSESAVCA